MTTAIGSFSLSLAMLASMAAVLMALAAVRFESDAFLAAARRLVVAFAVLIGVASAALMYGMVSSNFSIEYVAHFSERAMPAGYKMAAFWAGQEGSILLWALFIGVMSAMFVMSRRDDLKGGEGAAIVVTLALVCGFFACVLLFAKDAEPFKTNAEVPIDGRGLNPLLQDPAMIAHPPILFLGYAGFTVPFALLIGALVAGRRDNEWIASTRRWVLASWLFLTAGIMLGAWWAYIELGWGGYWAWDPVENASLLPWLTATALLHSIMPQQHRGMFKKWNASLIAMSFLLCIVATWITRSGAIQSVHAFGESIVGTFFLTFLIVAGVATVILLLVRRDRLHSEQEIETLVGREGAFLATNIVLVGMMLITLIGTLFPLITRTVGDHEVTVGSGYYNKVVAPMGMLLIGLMAMGPVLVYGQGAANRLLRGLAIPAVFAAAAVLTAATMGLHSVQALIAVAIVALGVACVLVDLVHVVRREGSIVRVLDANHRRYGGQLVHIGMMMILAGIVGSSLFKQETALENVKVGQSVSIGGQTLVLDGLRQVDGENFHAFVADLTLNDPSASVTTKLTPQMRRYVKFDRPEEMYKEVAISSSWKRDIYVTLAGFDFDAQTAAFEAKVNPLVSWIWIGTIVMAAGAVVCLTPRFLSHALPVATEAKPQTKASIPAGRPAVLKAS